MRLHPTDTPPAPLITMAEAAARLGVSRRTVESWVWLRRFPCVRMGRAVRIDPADVDSFIAEHRVETLEDTLGKTGRSSNKG